METQNRQNTPKELRNWTVKMRTFCAALTLALSLILAYLSGAAYETPTFSDVPKSHWAYAYVEQAAVQADTADWSSIPSRYRDAVAAVKSAGIISGIDREGRFAGDGAMTRAQAAVVLCRSALPTTAGTRRSLPEEIICQSPATWLSGPGRANHTPTST